MRILLDHCVAEPLRRYLTGHEVVPTRFVDLDNVDDGPMLAKAQEQGFEALVTVDANIPFQQNITAMALAVVVIHVRRNNLDRLIPLAPQVLKVLETARPVASITSTNRISRDRHHCHAKRRHHVPGRRAVADQNHF